MLRRGLRLLLRLLLRLPLLREEGESDRTYCDRLPCIFCLFRCLRKNQWRLHCGHRTV